MWHPSVAWHSFRNDPKSKWFIVKDIKELATAEQRRVRGKTILLGREDQISLFDLPKAQLNSRGERGATRQRAC